MRNAQRRRRVSSRRRARARARRRPPRLLRWIRIDDRGSVCARAYSRSPSRPWTRIARIPPGAFVNPSFTADLRSRVASICSYASTERIRIRVFLLSRRQIIHVGLITRVAIDRVNLGNVGRTRDARREIRTHLACNRRRARLSPRYFISPHGRGDEERGRDVVRRTGGQFNEQLAPRTSRSRYSRNLVLPRARINCRATSFVLDTRSRRRIGIGRRESIKVAVPAPPTVADNILIERSSRQCDVSS